MALYGGIEAGGTKMVCAVGTGPDDLHEIRFPTSTAEETLPYAVAFFREVQQAGDKLDAIGIASFGPIDPDPTSPTYGFVTTTPKPGWANVDFAGAIQRALDVPVAFDTDVNAAAFGEGRWGAAQGLHTCVYLTIGTGIGGGAVSNGKLLHGLMHPEMGHMRVPHDLERDPYPGYCGYHGDCWEGLAAGPAIERRWGMSGRLLPPDHPAWELEAHYLALGCVNITLIACPQRIIMGGGVMEQQQLFPLIRRNVQALLNGYLRVPHVAENIDAFIVPPALGNRAGVLGAIAMAEQAATQR
ncbi:MAG: ROK family protein [Chloroflexi bacterium]|nr:ROK family protein [Chloroflexota bacterium]